jgi:hypothetical protein
VKASEIGLNLANLIPKLNPEQREKVRLIQERIASLKDHQAWLDLERIAQKEIAKNTPRVSKFTVEEAAVIASQRAYVSGIEFILDIVENAVKTTK